MSRTPHDTFVRLNVKQQEVLRTIAALKLSEDDDGNSHMPIVRDLVQQLDTVVMDDDEREYWLEQCGEQCNNELECDGDALISPGSDPGAFVMTWTWVPDVRLVECEDCGEEFVPDDWQDRLTRTPLDEDFDTEDLCYDCLSTKKKLAELAAIDAAAAPFKIQGTQTGRFSCTNPPVSNIGKSVPMVAIDIEGTKKWMEQWISDHAEELGAAKLAKEQWEDEMLVLLQRIKDGNSAGPIFMVDSQPTACPESMPNNETLFCDGVH